MMSGKMIIEGIFRGIDAADTATHMLYQQLGDVVPEIMSGTASRAGVQQIDEDFSLVFVDEGEGVLTVTQFINFNTPVETMTEYVLYIDHEHQLATPLAVILTVPPASCVCEAREDMSNYLIALLRLAINQDHLYMKM